jgi:basic membrane protein A and related proteins
MKAFGPNAILTSIVDNWAPYYVGRVKAVMDGSWKSGDVWAGMNTGMMSMAGYGPGVAADTRTMADAVKAKIVAGEFHPFTGPLNKQDGTPFLKASEKISDKDLSGMTFYVQGIDGALPK